MHSESQCQSGAKPTWVPSLTLLKLRHIRMLTRILDSARILLRKSLPAGLAEGRARRLILVQQHAHGAQAARPLSAPVRLVGLLALGPVHRLRLLRGLRQAELHHPPGWLRDLGAKELASARAQLDRPATNGCYSLVGSLLVQIAHDAAASLGAFVLRWQELHSHDLGCVQTARLVQLHDCALLELNRHIRYVGAGVDGLRALAPLLAGTLAPALAPAPLRGGLPALHDGLGAPGSHGQAVR
mmetsp:Transcript_3648/g.7346  ORF Transcript_3648/g.7346 Transcript_3648/m.7346 type:complete len:242 (+) Transcript_3648:3-728(+)